MITIIGLLIAFFWPDITAFFEERQGKAIMLTDESGLAGDLDLLQSTEFSLVTAGDNPREAVKSGDTLAWVTISPGRGVISTKVVSNEPLGMNQQMEVDRLLGLVNRNYAALEAGIDPIKLEFIETLMPEVSSEVLSADTVRKTVEERQAGMWVSYFVAFVMYFFISMYGGLIIADIAEEKSMRIVDVLLSSISPMTHLMGKVASIIAVALSQGLIIAVALMAAMQVSGRNLSEMLRGVNPGSLGFTLNIETCCHTEHGHL